MFASLFYRNGEEYITKEKKVKLKIVLHLQQQSIV